MKEKETVRVEPEQLPRWRRGADKLVGAGQVIDVVTLGVGVLVASGTIIALGAGGLVGGKLVREQWLRRMPKGEATRRVR